SIVFENLSIGGKFITWDFGDGTVIAQQETDPRFLVHQYQQAGQYQVKLKITDLSTCSQTDSTMQLINYFEHNITAGAGAEICEGTTFQLTANGGVDYQWTTDSGFASSSPSPVVQPDTTTQYYLTAIDANGCTGSDTVEVVVVDKVDLKWQYQVNGSCMDRPTILRSE